MGTLSSYEFGKEGGFFDADTQIKVELDGDAYSGSGDNGRMVPATKANLKLCDENQSWAVLDLNESVSLDLIQGFRGLNVPITGPGGDDCGECEVKDYLEKDLAIVRELYDKGKSVRPSDGTDGVWDLGPVNAIMGGDYSPGNKNGLQIRNAGERAQLEMRWNCAIEPGTEPYPGFVAKLEVEMAGSMVWDSNNSCTFTSKGKQVTYQGAQGSFQEMWQGDGAVHDEELSKLKFQLVNNCLRITGNMGKVGPEWEWAADLEIDGVDCPFLTNR